MDHQNCNASFYSEDSISSGEECPPKLFKDAIHGDFELPPLCVRIINTPQFNRLRFLKQLGFCYFVYPSAAHNRFEHSIGVCYLAGVLGQHLQTQVELEVTDKDVLCLQVAGLCHDLGHGPFSHLWQEFICKNVDANFQHEEMSKKMFNYIIEENNIDLKKYNLTNRDKVFIHELICHKDPGADWSLQGRTEEKSFLYQVVANAVNGIDVDKFDYFLRDCHGLGFSIMFDYQRLIKNCRVIKVNLGEYSRQTICFRDKEASSIMELFHSRVFLHKKAYQHRVARVIDVM